MCQACCRLKALVVYGTDRAPVLWACVLLEITDNRQIKRLDERREGDGKRLLFTEEAVETKARKERRCRVAF